MKNRTNHSDKLLLFLLTIAVACLSSYDLFAQENIRMIAETKYEKMDSR